jgi:hypothetical protein
VSTKKFGLACSLDFLGTKVSSRARDTDLTLAAREAVEQKLEELAREKTGVIAADPGGPIFNFDVEPNTSSLTDSLLLTIDAPMDKPDHILLVFGRIISRVVIFSAMKGELMRGAVAYGKFARGSVRRGQVFGPAIEELAKLSESLRMAGVLACPSIRQYAPKSLGDPFCFINPRTVGVVSDGSEQFALTWPRLWGFENVLPTTLRAQVERLFDRAREDPSAAEKSSNTLAFIDGVIDQMRHENPDSFDRRVRDLSNI